MRKKVPKQLKKLLPKNQHDIEAANLIIKLGYPMIEPVLYELLKWLRDDWPITPPLVELFVSLESRALPEVAKALRSNQDLWKYNILSKVVKHWPAEVIKQLRNELLTIVTEKGTQALEAAILLVSYEMADYDWVLGWLKFRKDRHQEMLNKIQKTIDEIKKMR